MGLYHVIHLVVAHHVILDDQVIQYPGDQCCDYYYHWSSLNSIDWNLIGQSMPL